MKTSILIGLMILSLLLISGASGCKPDDQTFNDTQPQMKCSEGICWMPGQLFVKFNEDVSGEEAFNFVHSLGLQTQSLTPGGEHRNAALIIIGLPEGKELTYLSTLNKTGLIKSISLSEIYTASNLPPTVPID